jgi:hypothetical protein
LSTTNPTCTVRTRILAAAMGTQRLIASAMARPQINVILISKHFGRFSSEVFHGMSPHCQQISSLAQPQYSHHIYISSRKFLSAKLSSIFFLTKISISHGSWRSILRFLQPLSVRFKGDAIPGAGHEGP